jgi:iron complex transport system substrate-binding protein
MKTKNKVLVMVEIAVVLCSVFLVAIPAITADQTAEKASASEVTTVSEDDYVLGIYGNANEDDTIDMGDVVYTKLAIFGKKPKTELCDAKYDGRINVLDIIQTKLIILGKEKEITIIDSYDRIVTVKKPVKRVVAAVDFFAIGTLRAIKVPREIIVGIPGRPNVADWELYFAEYKDKTCIGSMWNPDIEAILNLDPDVVFLSATPGLRGSGSVDRTTDVLESAGITVLRFYHGSSSNYVFYPKELTKLGYIMDKEEEAEEFRDWYEGVVNLVKERVETIPEEDKPKVYYELHSRLWNGFREQLARVGLAGGKNIFPDGQAIDPEAVITEDPDIIVKVAPGGDVTAYHLDAEDTTAIEKVREEVMSRPELQNVGAVKTGRVYVLSIYFMPGRTAGYGGVRNFVQIVYNAKWFHPDLFKDVDPEAIHQEYLTRFQGLDIDLDEKGVFVYPEPS